MKVGDADPAYPSSSIQERTAHWFKRASAFLLDQLPCRAGCSHCCIGPFAITLVDRAVLREGLERLSSATRQGIEQRALDQSGAMATAFPRLRQSIFVDAWPDQDIDQLVSRFESVACPALGQDGLCLVYEHRPLACRSMGIPIEDGSLTTGACGVQTFVPIIKLSSSLRAEELRLADQEAAELQRLRRMLQSGGEELLLPYGFLSAEKP